MRKLKDLKEHVMKMDLGPGTYLFVDIDQIDVRWLERNLPKGTTLIGMVGKPNVESLTREALHAILDRKP